MVLDTDTFNEVDNQLALVYAMRSTERLRVEALYAAPFLNDRSETPGDGDPLHVVAIGAITNVASAIILRPEIIDRIVVVWLGGNPVHFADTVRGYREDHFAWAREIWDIAAIGWMVDPQRVPTVLDHSPVLSARLTWSVDKRRHLIRSAYSLARNPIFANRFRKIARENPAH